MKWASTIGIGASALIVAALVACSAGKASGTGGGGTTPTTTSSMGGHGGTGAGGSASGGTAGSGGAATGVGGLAGGAGGVGGSGGAGGGGGAGGAGGSGGTVGCVIASYSFDNCADGWTAGGRNSDWACGNVTSGPNGDHTGDHFLWATDLAGDANTCQDSWLESPELDLAAYSGATLRLAFWHWYDFRECTCGNLCLATPTESDSGGMLKVDSGSGWTLVAPIGGYEHGGFEVNCAAAGFCGESPCELDGEVSAFTAAGVEQVWHESTVDISAHAASAFKVRFLFGSHSGFGCFPDRAGWYVDDVLIYTEEACP